MRKKYSKPIAAAFCITTEQVIAASPEIPFIEEKVDANFEVLGKDDDFFMNDDIVITDGDDFKGIW